MDNVKDTSTEGTQTSTVEVKQGKLFTQDDVNRIVQERLAKEKGKGTDELEKRAAELDRRERRMNVIDELRKNNLPDYLADALNVETDEMLHQSMEIIKKMKGEATESSGKIIGVGNPIGTVTKGNDDDIRKAFGLG